MKYIITTLILFASTCSQSQSQSQSPINLIYVDKGFGIIGIVEFKPGFYSGAKKYDRLWKLSDFYAYPDDGINDFPIIQKLMDSALLLKGITALYLKSGNYCYGEDRELLRFNTRQVVFVFEDEKTGKWSGSCFGCCFDRPKIEL